MPRAFTSSLIVALLLAAVPALSETIPLKSQGGIFVVPVVINDQITLNFTLDSGAADVSIPADVFSTLVRTGTIQDSDYLGVQTYVLADGSKQRSHRFRIRSLRVGGLELRDVVGSVSPSSGSLLLGQSFLGRLGTWAVDNRQHALLINEAGYAQSAPPPAYQPSASPRPTIIPAMVGNSSADGWYQCMKRLGWRDNADDACKTSDIQESAAAHQQNDASALQDQYEKCVLLLGASECTELNARLHASH